MSGTLDNTDGNNKPFTLRAKKSRARLRSRKNRKPLPPAAAPPPKTSKLAALVRRCVRWLLLLGALLIIGIAILMLCARIGLPLLSSYKGDIENRLSDQMRSPVVIDNLSMRWEGFGPTLTAQGVSLGDPTKQPVSLDEVLIDMNLWKSASQGAPVIDELTLVGVKLSLEANERGRFELQGIQRSQDDQAGQGDKESSQVKSKSSQKDGRTSSSKDNRADVLSWVMNTPRVGLQDSSITLVDVINQEELTITDVNILAINDDDSHQLRLDMQLPDALGGNIELGVDYVGSSDDTRNIDAEFHLKATDMRMDAWRTLQAKRMGGLKISTTGIAQLDANAQFELWGNMSGGSLQAARGQFSATDLVDLKKQQRILDKISTDVFYKNTDGGWQISTDALELVNGDETTIVQDVVYDLRPTEGTAWKLDARGDALDLDVATRLVLSLFDDAINLPRVQWLGKAEPKGELLDWSTSVALVDGKPNTSLSSVFKGLELTAADGVPGVSNLEGSIELQNNMGTMTLKGADSILDFPALYSNPLSVEKIAGEFDLDVRDTLRTSLKGNMVLADDGVDTNTRFEVKLKPGSAPHIYAQGKFSVDDLAKATRWIPVRKLRTATSDWFQRALVAGKATNGEILMFGDANEFPFADNEGVFKLGLDFKDATVDYFEGWPVVAGTSGRLEMQGPTVHLTSSDGAIDSMRLSDLDVKIPDIMNPVLEVASTSAGSLPKLIDFANTGPLKATLAPALGDVVGTGRAQMDLSITLPLRSPRTVTTVASAQAQAASTGTIPGLKVNGSLFLRNNDIAMDVAGVNLTGVDGAIGFTEDSVRVNNLQATMYGKPVRVDSKTEGRGTNRTAELTMRGRLPGRDVLENYEIPLTQFVEGESQWNVSVRVPMTEIGLERDGILVAAVSDLVGTRLILPAPLGKSSRSATRLALSSSIDPDADGTEWVIDYGDTMRSRVRADEEGLQAFEGRFGGGAAGDVIKDGIRLIGNIDELVLDGWVETVSDFLDGLEEEETPTPIMPISADLNIGQYIVGIEPVGAGKLGFNTDSDYVNAKIDSPWLNASARYPRKHWSKDLPAVIRVTSVDKRIVDALDSVPDSPDSDELDPRELPPIHARIERIQWDQLDLRGLTIRTSPAVSGVNIDTFGFAYQSAQLIGSGYWRLRDPQGVNPLLKDQHKTRLNLTLQSDNFGQLLSDVGYQDVLAEGEGVIEGSLDWSGPFYKPDLEEFIGEIDVALEKGRFLTVEPGAVRFAGLFAFQTIPRRLSLDFKDLVLEGLDYETIKGTVQLANGIAHTPLMQLNGAVGVVDITGESDLVDEQYNQRITVLPRVSAALPIIGIITGGATAGLGALFAGGVLKAIGVDFDRLGMREYSLKGSWEEPKLKHVPLRR